MNKNEQTYYSDDDSSERIDILERLTKRSNIAMSVPSENLGDLCMRMDFCDEFDFCIGCPVKKLMDRLCEYEDTGFTPEQIMEMKKSADIKKCQRKDVLGVPKNYDGTFIQRVSRRGVKINGEYFYDDRLVFNYLGQKVKIVINGNVAAVFDLGYKSEYPIAGFILETFNCKHTFHSYTNDRNMSDYRCTREDIAKVLKQIETIKKFKR